MQKIVPCLWFDMGDAERAVGFYQSIFPDFKILERSYYTKSTPAPEGTLLTIDFELFGQRYVALNGGPQFRFTDAVSFIVMCDSQEEIDYYWEHLLAGGGHPEQCGWLRDKFGLPWQIAPGELDLMIRDPDREKADAVLKAMMGMVKIDMEALRRAYAG
jgi:predicted 3-demethylubiquinone-9 3-methyltransferase (glyoxalase superfamily)